MATRPMFLAVPSPTAPFKMVMVEFQWFAGLSISQKQKSVQSLHRSAADSLKIGPILEISSKSLEPLGVKLSAFNLRLSLPNGIVTSVEAAYQGSKVTTEGGPYEDLFGMNALDAKRDPRVKGKNLRGFRYGDRDWPLIPTTYFYDWLFIGALCERQNGQLLERVLQFDAFTDIEFNPEKQLSCQARSTAIFCGLIRGGAALIDLADPKRRADLLRPCYGADVNGSQPMLI